MFLISIKSFHRNDRFDEEEVNIRFHSGNVGLEFVVDFFELRIEVVCRVGASHVVIPNDDARPDTGRDDGKSAANYLAARVAAQECFD